MWTAPKEAVRTGGTNFQKQSLQARTLEPMAGSTTGASVDWNKGMYGGHFPQQYPTAQPMMGPPMAAPMMAPQYPVMMQQPYMVSGSLVPACVYRSTTAAWP